MQKDLLSVQSYCGDVETRANNYGVSVDESHFRFSLDKLGELEDGVFKEVNMSGSLSKKQLKKSKNTFRCWISPW